jgi:MscS family membrane protein
VVAIGLLYVLQSLNFDITTLLAGISIGGIALALAAQDTLKNFFGSLMIFIDKPFQIGDWINFNEVDGTVEEVGFRSTRVRTFANSLVYVPNGKLADSTIDNFGLRQYRRFSTTISLTYDTPTALIRQFVDGLNEIVANHPDTRKDFWEVKLNTMGSHSLNIMFYIFFAVP